METNKKTSSERISAAALLFIFLVLLGILQFGFGLKLFIFGLSPYFVWLILIIILILFPLFDGTPSPTKQDKMDKVLYAVFATIIILGGIFFYLIGFSDDKYFSFKNPSGNKTLVVSTNYSLLSGNGTFYVKKYGVFIKDINQFISLDAGDSPFSTNHYTIDWTDDYTAVIRYASNGFEKDPSHWFMTTVKLR